MSGVVYKGYLHVVLAIYKGNINIEQSIKDCVLANKPTIYHSHTISS